MLATVRYCFNIGTQTYIVIINLLFMLHLYLFGFVFIYFFLSDEIDIRVCLIFTTIYGFVIGFNKMIDHWTFITMQMLLGSQSVVSEIYY